ncbi:glycoside hydrolase family 2 protein [Ruania albidiflava]|uniref:glycoside hydrolase family 2 protein n=1 Tax=Ruania albidiflava TaxID=366586 RepID=UPI0023EFBEE0|nr:glycoside hydrolase family 2 TIM barrel-domain containing protein [Ruania albidiflava]
MTMLTRWGRELDRDHPLPEYPRPQLVRGDWANLNGRWSYAITAFADDGGARPGRSAAPGVAPAVADPTVPPARWDGTIVVPFSPETPLSGVERTVGVDQTLWYHRTFAPPRPLTDGERLLLHFGAADQSCRVAVDGVEVGGHTGGYLPFTLDLTAVVRSRGAGSGPVAGPHELVVAVRDVTDAAWLARGKQSRTRGGIWYTPQSGIWQTVWCEIVPAVAIEGLTLTPSLDDGTVEVTVHSEHAAPTDLATIRVTAPGSPAASVSRAAPVTSTVIPVNTPSPVLVPGPVQLWTPERPALYDVQVELGTDRVVSYVGMRSFGLDTDDRGHARLLLNGRPYLQVGLLDQGYWPDGGYTAPSEAALVYDIQLAKDLGFTMLRKHIKIEPLRWYHHCDRLGMLVWQDAVNGGARYRPGVITTPVAPVPHRRDTNYAAFGRSEAAGRSQFENELTAMIEHLRSVPSLALWVPFNEGWGQFDAARIAGLVRQLDPTRPIDHASGWHDQGAGDLHSLHIYFRPVHLPKAPRRRWPRWVDGHLLRRPPVRAVALTEYGGYSLALAGHTWGERTFGYRHLRTARELTEALRTLHHKQIEPAVRRGLAATVYTQLTDVEDEVNGLVTYDRDVVKVPVAELREITDRLRAVAAEMGSHHQPHSGQATERSPEPGETGSTRQGDH